MKTITIDGVGCNLTPKETKSKWRLPTINELVAIFDYDKGEPKIDGFNSDYYWSLNTKDGYLSNAWRVYLSSGSVGYYPKAYRYYVRCVRDTDNGFVWSKSSEKPMTWYEAIEYAKNMEDEDEK